MIEKDFILKNNKKEIIMSERQILINIQHKFITKMYWAFQTVNQLFKRHYLVFVLEFCPGGDFFTHLKELRTLSEQQARPYFIQTCLALSYLHQNHIIYRDLKPENILFDLEGNMKITDFGLAKELGSNERAYSFCGSSEFRY